MNGRRWVLPVVLLALVGAWAASIRLTGRAYLPRHTSARDLPYALARPDVPPQPFNRAMTDPMNLILPDQAFAKRELEAGRVPIWNHGILGGVPHAANPITGTFYPPNLLVAFFDPVDFLLVSAALHLVLAGLFFHWFLLAAGARPTSATVGSLAFAFSGWMAAHLHNTMIAAVAAWIPLGLAGIEWVLRGRRKAGTLAIALSVAMQWLAGFPQLAVIGTLTLAVFAVVSLAAARAAGPPRARARLAGWILAAALLGLAIAWIQIHPSLDVRGRAPRHGTERAVLLEQAFTPGVLGGLAFPLWLGDAHEKPVTEPPVEGDLDHAARHFAGRLGLGARDASGVRQISLINSFGERTIYAGAPILVLALCGLLASGRRAALALLSAAILAAAFAFGLLPPDPVLALLGLNIGAPGRAIAVCAFVIPALAAFGLDRLLDPERRRAAGAWIVLRAAGVVFGLGLLAAAGAAFVARETTLDLVIRVLRAWNAPAALGAAADRPAAGDAAILAPAFDRLRLDVLRMSLFVLGAWAALEWARRDARKQPASDRRAFAIAIAGLAIVVVADLGGFFLRLNRPVLREGLFPETPALEFLRREAPRSRFVRLSPDRAAALGDMHVLFPPNMGMIHGLRDAQGYRDLVPPRVLRLLEGTSVLLSTGGAAGVALQDARSPVLDLMAARWLIAARPLDEESEAFRQSGLARAGPDSRPAAESAGDVALYENPDALPLAFAVHEAVVMKDDEALEALKSGAFDPRTRVILDSIPSRAARTAEQAGGPGVVTARFDGDAVRVDATLSAPGFVVVSEAWDPGWKAALWHGPWAEDRGDDLEIVRANVAFMAVWVPAGKHTIELRYRPAALAIGTGVAAAGAFVLLLLTLWPRRRARREAPPPETPQEAPPQETPPPELPPSDA